MAKLPHPLLGRPVFCSHMKSKLAQAVAITQVINTAAYSADGAEGIGGSAWAVASMLTEIEEYIEENFDSMGIDGTEANNA